VFVSSTLPTENSQVNNYLCRQESILQRIDLSWISVRFFRTAILHFVKEGAERSKLRRAQVP
jgi:hypothetical protein